MSCLRNSGRNGEFKLRSRLSGEEGSALVETAIACTILLAVLLGVFDMSLAAYTVHSVSEGAREATRYAIVRGSNCVNLSACGASNSDIQTFVRSLGYPGVKAAKLTTATTWYNVSMDTTKTPPSAVVTSCGTSPGGCNLPGNQVQVQVSYAFSFSLPYYGSKTLNLTSTSAMVISQ